MTKLGVLTFIAFLTAAHVGFAQGYAPSHNHSVAVQFRTEPGQRGDTAPKACPLPAFPHELLIARVNGEATVSFLVREDGSVADVSIVAASQREFAEPTKAIVARWQFFPVKDRSSGKSTTLRMTSRIVFKIEEE